ncbi:MAG: hypothetical protein RL385_4712, partial [Pseudomonadota bacterium]
MHSSRNVALVAALVAACGSDQGVLTNIVAESSDAATPLPLADAGVGKSETTTTRGGQGAMDASAPTGRPESSGDGGTCEVHDIGHGRIAPDILIVLDRSGSMRNRGTDRWGPSVSALGTITSSLDESVKFGLMVFPGEADEAALMV